MDPIIFPNRAKSTSETARADDRATEVSNIIESTRNLIVPFIRAADEDSLEKSSGHGRAKPGGKHGTVLVEYHRPDRLQHHLSPSLPTTGLGASGLLDSASSILKYSVNTWDHGFLDKLYASTDAPGLAAELLLATLNTNVHVYNVSPALTLVEKHTARALASLFGFTGANAGGVTVPGGTASNITSVLIARNIMFPQAKTQGVAAIPEKLVLFASAEAHYSITMASVQLGLGSASVRKVSVNPNTGVMDANALADLVADETSRGYRPFYVCATAGTTVRGAYDPLKVIAKVCSKAGMWMHVDACWGGGVAFSPKLRVGRLEGIEEADSISFNAHKMLGVPLTCAFLLGKDMRKFWEANRTEAKYLFHEPPKVGATTKKVNGSEDQSDAPSWNDIHDLATLVPNCGRRGDSLKLYLAWQYHGSVGFASQVEAAFAAAALLAEALAKEPGVDLLSEWPPPCCQVCFYYVGKGHVKRKRSPGWNSLVTRGVVRGLVSRGWMVDYAGGDEGEFLRVVCNRGTSMDVVHGLIKAILAVGEAVVQELKMEL